MTVIVYTKPNCQPCRATKRWLKDRGIEYAEESLEDDGNLAAAKALGHLEAPVVVVGGESWSGFRPDMLGTIVEGERKAA